MKGEYQITYIGSCNEDWNGEVDQRVIESFATIERFPGEDRSFPKGKVELLEDIVLELFDEINPSERVFVVLSRGEYIWDKNILERGGIQPIIAKKHFELGAALRRPGGGPTNCAYNTATLYASMGVETNVRLVVLEASKYCREIFNREIQRKDKSNVVEILPIREEGPSFSNINLAVDTHKNGEREKFDFTTREEPFKDSEVASLEEKLNSDSPQMYVVNSIKDPAYSNTVEKFLSKQNGRGNKFVLAATTSMINKNYDSTFRLMGRSDIYVSNIEELYDLLGTVKVKEKGKEKVVRKTKCGSWEEQTNWEELLDDTTEIAVIERKVPNQRLIDGIMYIQEQQLKGNGKRGRVYITCGRYGAVAADEEGNIYFQATHPEAVKQAKFLNGAGDSFAGIMTGFEALKSNQPIDRILSYAVAGSQIEVRTRGANNKDALTKAAIELELQKYQGKMYKLDKGSFQPQ